MVTADTTRYRITSSATGAREIRARAQPATCLAVGMRQNSTDVVGPSSNNRHVTDLNPANVIDSLASNPGLRVFVRGRHLETMPSRMSRRRLLLDEIAQGFEPGIRYTERTVNDFLSAIYSDCAALRRYLVDEGFLDRADGLYWRVGGTSRI